MRKATKSRGRRRFIERGPNRVKTLAEVLELKEGEFTVDEQTGIALSLEHKAMDEMVYMGDLLNKFYNRNEDQMPLVMILIDEPNPVVAGSKMYQVVMRASFFLKIEAGRDRSGPHRTVLYFRNFSKPIVTTEIAAVQLMAFFFNETEMRDALIKAVTDREFFMLPVNRDIPIRL